MLLGANTITSLLQYHVAPPPSLHATAYRIPHTALVRDFPAYLPRGRGRGGRPTLVSPRCPSPSTEGRPESSDMVCYQTASGARNQQRLNMYGNIPTYTAQRSPPPSQNAANNDASENSSGSQVIRSDNAWFLMQVYARSYWLPAMFSIFC